MLRGANPAAECPRCSAISPPQSIPLVTCARCALVFTPGDRQVRVRHAIIEPRVVPEPPAAKKDTTAGLGIVLALQIAWLAIDVRDRADTSGWMIALHVFGVVAIGGLWLTTHVRIRRG